MTCTTDHCSQSCTGGKCRMKCRTKNSCEQQCSSLRRICPLVECHSKEKSCTQVSLSLPLQIKLKRVEDEFYPLNTLLTRNRIFITGGGGGTPYNGLYGEAPPERSIFFRLQVYKRVGTLLVEVYERAGKSVVPVCERAQRANRWILWLFNVEKTFYFCDWFLPREDKWDREEILHTQPIP